MSIRGPVRQSQVISPFGPGSLYTDRFGVSLICCGLDHWFEGADDIKEFVIDDEWRIKRDLGVNELKLPPDYRRLITGQEVPNTGLTIPFLRFPTWHYCTNFMCGYMERSSLTYQGQKNCPDCKQKTSFDTPLVQVRFVATCQHGHIQDFPWNEWAHQSHSPGCNGQSLRLIEYGGGTLESIEIKCRECGDGQRLSGITSSDLVIGGERFLCTGKRPWLHDEEGSDCGEPLRGSLRNASNLYFAIIFSSIFLPRRSKPVAVSETVVSDAVHVLGLPAVSAMVDTLVDLGIGHETIIEKLREKHKMDFAEFSDQEIGSALNVYAEISIDENIDPGVDDSEPYDYKSFRFEEYKVLAQVWDEPDLMTREAVLSEYSESVSRCFSKIMLLHKLRETRAFRGFTRINSTTDRPLDDLKDDLWQNPPQGPRKWLPASIVYGEGIFLEFNENSLHEWINGEAGNEIIGRINRLRENYTRATAERPGMAIYNEFHPVFIMIHSFAHILMNQLTYECGYSSASLRERLYFSSDPETPMAGLMIYTAAGDSEGTMGGLVRMATPDFFEPLLRQAITRAEWCSADPVCMELGNHGGQGPYSCNLAACHNCALVPETACEEFNRFLDRGVVTGMVENRGLGFFTKLFK